MKKSRKRQHRDKESLLFGGRFDWRKSKIDEANGKRWVMKFVESTDSIMMFLPELLASDEGATMLPKLIVDFGMRAKITCIFNRYPPMSVRHDREENNHDSAISGPHTGYAEDLSRLPPGKLRILQ